MTPLAMKCTEKQFNKIRRFLPNVDRIDDFKTHPWLVNDFEGFFDIVSNIMTPNRRHEIHEKFNAEIFLNSLDIELPKTYQKKVNGVWQDIKYLQKKAKAHGMKVTVTFEKIY